eukprot:TRINITY_DN13715_c0_g1_i4.p1 TRINITY_DN13715_c0_g1~~TRINITY_DN13715_c0_g1_i4.p1  ORF type:complete len:159 (-),score=29.98 TRINITY_DN13715_c0_g1_i4:92-568(-)
MCRGSEGSGEERSSVSNGSTSFYPDNKQHFVWDSFLKTPVPPSSVRKEEIILPEVSPIGVVLNETRRTEFEREEQEEQEEEEIGLFDEDIQPRPRKTDRLEDLVSMLAESERRSTLRALQLALVEQENMTLRQQVINLSRSRPKREKFDNCSQLCSLM